MDRGAALGGVTAHDPEALHRHGVLDGDHRIDAARQRDRDPGAHVVEFGFHPRDPGTLLGPSQAVPDGLGEGEVVLAVSRRRRGGIAGLREFLARVVANRFQHAVAHAFVALVGHHQRLVDQRCHEVEHVGRLQRLGTADLLGGLEVETADEHGQPAQHRSLGRVEQVVGPVDQRTQRLLTLQQHPAASGQQPVAILQPRVELGHGSSRACEPRPAPAPAECPPAAPPAAPRPAPRARSARTPVCATAPARRTVGPRSSATAPRARRRAPAPAAAAPGSSARPGHAAPRGWTPGCSPAARHAGSRWRGRPMPGSGARSCRISAACGAASAWRAASAERAGRAPRARPAPAPPRRPPAPDRGSAPGPGTRHRRESAPSPRPRPAATTASCPTRPCPARSPAASAREPHGPRAARARGRRTRWSAAAGCSASAAPAATARPLARPGAPSRRRRARRTRLRRDRPRTARPARQGP